MVLPISDSFWVNQFPGNEWNCKCDVEQTRAKADVSPTSLPKSPEGLEGNPAFTGGLIGNKHPYFKGLNKTEKKQVGLVVQKETDKQVNAWARKNIHPEEGLSVNSKVLQTRKVHLFQKDVKSIVKKQEDAFSKTYITVLSDDLPSLQYLGFEKTGQNLFTCYETSYGDRTLFIKMKVTGEVEQPYSVDRSIDKSVIIKENVPVQ